mmetsp:Transcript_23666/g.89853  ORF Transcript_23666/g.89853 Transcript_23666/m.89853 type:complete len:271 (+) Transcript_23666:14734-15546(+)
MRPSNWPRRWRRDGGAGRCQHCRRCSEPQWRRWRSHAQRHGERVGQFHRERHASRPQRPGSLRTRVGERVRPRCVRDIDEDPFRHPRWPGSGRACDGAGRGPGVQPSPVLVLAPGDRAADRSRPRLAVRSQAPRGHGQQFRPIANRAGGPLGSGRHHSARRAHPRRGSLSHARRGGRVCIRGRHSHQRCRTAESAARLLRGEPCNPQRRNARGHRRCGGGLHQRRLDRVPQSEERRQNPPRHRHADSRGLRRGQTVPHFGPPRVSSAWRR